MKLRIGLPKGSLNDTRRGNTYEIIKRAGYDIEGYEPGKEYPIIQFLNDDSIEGVLVRPQSASFDVAKGLIDATITGADWSEELSLAGFKTQKICDFDYGNTQLVVAGKDKKLLDSLKNKKLLAASNFESKPLICSTEYVMIAANYLENAISMRDAPRIYVRGIEKGYSAEIKIFGSEGLTESYIEKGFADIIIDNTMTGKTLEKYGLIEGETIMTSSAGLYTNTTTLKDADKRKKLTEIVENINAGILANKSNYIAFNVAKSNMRMIDSFLYENKLFEDEPTVNIGENFAEYVLLVKKSQVPLAISGLKGLNAKSFVVTEPKMVFR